MEPVFLAAAADAIPELRRFVVSDGRRVALTEDLAEAISRLAGRETPSAPGAQDAVGAVGRGAATGWPASALDLLNQAEAHLRAGEWQAYGEALAKLRALLEGLRGSGAGE
jgi:uncharacterized membrane protein (UPF0182 family)